MRSKTSLAIRKFSIKRRTARPFFSIIALFIITVICAKTAVYFQSKGKDEIKNDIDLKSVFSKMSSTLGLKDHSDDPDIKEVIASVNEKAEDNDPKKYTPFENSCLPINSSVNSSFGYRDDPFSGQTVFHGGVDIKASEGTEVRCVLDGKVVKVSEDEIGGKFIKIEHDNGFITYYGHLSEYKISEGEYVKTGQTVALSGQTGKVTGPHLHFQLIYDGHLVDPQVYFKFNEN